jgi:hypothetical protein
MIWGSLLSTFQDGCIAWIDTSHKYRILAKRSVCFNVLLSAFDHSYDLRCHRHPEDGEHAPNSLP